MLDQSIITAEKIAERYLVDDFFFIQIGANDGERGDPIHDYVKKYGWKGILVEPVSYIFEKLKRTYEDMDGLYFVNAAVDSQDGYREFYRLKENDEAGIPAFYDMIGSFRKDAITKFRGVIPNFDRHLIAEPVKCISFSSLLNQFHVKKIDLLLLDTEGYDFEIIKLIPFDQLKPNLILYEHFLLSREENSECSELLEANGYKMVTMKQDTLAYF